MERKTCKQCFLIAKQGFPDYIIVNKKGEIEEAFICQKDDPAFTTENATACKDFFNDSPDLVNDEMDVYTERIML